MIGIWVWRENYKQLATVISDVSVPMIGIWVWRVCSEPLSKTQAQVSVPMIGIWVWRVRGLKPLVCGNLRVGFGKGRQIE